MKLTPRDKKAWRLGFEAGLEAGATLVEVIAERPSDSDAACADRWQRRIECAPPDEWPEDPPAPKAGK